jgi:hypothetical protein
MAEDSTPESIQELSKRLSKAILIRRVKKSDGSVVSERAPIQIIQGEETFLELQKFNFFLKSLKFC